MKSEAVQTDCKLSLIDNLQNKSNHHHYYKSTIVNSSQRRQSWSFFTIRKLHHWKWLSLGIVIIWHSYICVSELWYFVIRVRWSQSTTSTVLRSGSVAINWDLTKLESVKYTDKNKLTCSYLMYTRTTVDIVTNTVFHCNAHSSFKSCWTKHKDTD